MRSQTIFERFNAQITNNKKKNTVIQDITLMTKGDNMVKNIGNQMIHISPT